MLLGLPLLAVLASATIQAADDSHPPETATITSAPADPPPREPDPATTRYLYAPSALPLGKGRTYFSQKELIFSGVATGITNRVSVLVGSVVPGLLVGLINGETDAINGIFALRGSAPIGDKVWIGGGAETFLFMESGFSMPFVNATYGRPDHHITVGSGAGVMLGKPKVEFVPVVVAGTHRVSDGGALVTENWMVFPTNYDTDPILLSAVGWRFIAGQLTADLALINIISDGYFPLPWLDIAYHWGGRK